MLLHRYSCLFYSYLIIALFVKKILSSIRVQRTMWCITRCYAVHDVMRCTMWCDARCDAMHDVMRCTMWCCARCDAVYDVMQCTMWWSAGCDHRTVCREQCARSCWKLHATNEKLRLQKKTAPAIRNRISYFVVMFFLPVMLHPADRELFPLCSVGDWRAGQRIWTKICVLFIILPCAVLLCWMNRVHCCSEEIVIIKNFSHLNIRLAMLFTLLFYNGDWWKHSLHRIYLCF